MSERKKAPSRTSEGAHSNDDRTASGSRSRPNRDGDLNTRMLRSLPKTKAPEKATESSTDNVGKSTPRRNYNVTRQSTCPAPRNNNNERSQPFENLRRKSVWTPSRSKDKTLNNLASAKPSNLDTRRNTFDEVHQLGRPEVHESHSTPKNTLDSVSGKPPPVIKTASTPATCGTILYSTIAAKHISPQDCKSPKSNARPPDKTNDPSSLFVPFIPNWPLQIKRMSQKLCYKPVVRSYGNGVQFMPKTLYEYKSIKGYLKDLKNTEPAISSCSDTPSDEFPTKVGIRGIPFGTPLSELKEALRAHGFLVESIEAIPPTGRSECMYTVKLKHMSDKQIQRLYAINELMFMSGVVVEDLSKTGSAQLKPTQLQKTFENVPESGTKKDDKWTPVGKQKGRKMPPLSDHTKDPVSRLLELNRYNTGTEINTPPNEPPLNNEPVSVIKTKSKKRREKRKERENECNLLYYSATSFTLTEEATGSEDQGINVEFREENVVQNEDSTPPQPTLPVIANLEDMLEDAINKLFSGLTKTLPKAQRALIEKDVCFQEIVTSINKFLEKYKGE